eukprot:symbB.v1.2.004247.t1/scaffold241.1/size254724/2
MRSIVDAMWTLIQDVSLEDFLRSGKWAETILTRLYGHSKKTAYYLLSDGMPLLSGRLPVSDVFLSKEDEDFQHLLRRRLNLHLPLPITDAKNYLKRNVTAAFGRICASLVIALELPAALLRAEELLRSWVEKNDYGDLFFSHWPVYRLMLYLHRKLSRDSHAEMYSETAKLSQSMQHAWEQSAEMLVISCLPNLTGSLPQGWHHRSGCHGPSWRQVLDGYEKVRWVLLISSTMHWSVAGLCYRRPLGKSTSNFLLPRIEFLFDFERTLEEAEIEDGECLTALVLQPQLAATERAFALWCRGDSAIVTWGHPYFGGDTSAVRDHLRGVQQIQATLYGAFAAILEDESVVTWGDRRRGGDSSAVRDQLKGVQQIQASYTAFAAILKDGSVVTWGDADHGGDSSAVQHQLRGQLKGVLQIQATERAFAAILQDGSVVTWGDADDGGDSSAVRDQLRGVQQIQAANYAFAAILEDGSVVTWGHADLGGDSSAVRDQLKGAQQIQATRDAFAAILADGSVVSWGDARFGGDSSAVRDQLKRVQQIQATGGAFAAMREDCGGDSLGDHHVGSIREGLALAEEAGKMAVGFPTVDRTGTWKWPVRRFEMDGNISVRYLPYPTGYAGSHGRCCRGDTTSGTRAYHWDTLAQFFEEADRFFGKAETMSSLLQRLDFLAQSNSKGYASMTCMVPPLVEDDYAKTRLLHYSDLPDDMQKMLLKSRPSPAMALPISQDLDPGPKEVVVLYCGELDLKIESRCWQLRECLTTN